MSTKTVSHSEVVDRVCRIRNILSTTQEPIVVVNGQYCEL